MKVAKFIHDTAITLVNGTEMNFKKGSEYKAITTFIDSSGSEMVIIHKAKTAPMAVRRSLVEII